MSLIRVKFNSSASDSGAYSVAINPIDIIVPRSDIDIQVAHKTLDGINIYFQKAYDNRQYALIWKNITQETYATMISTLAGYTFDDFLLNYKYIHLGDIGTYLGKFATWTRVKIRGLDIAYKPGSAFIISEMKLIFEIA